jgi:hypothetical protein
MRELKYILFASTTNGFGILNFVYRGTIFSGDPKNPQRFLFCFIQSFSSPPTSLENLCDNSLTVCFSRTNIVELVIIFSISDLLFLMLSFKVGDDDGDGDGDDNDNDNDDMIIMLTLF